MKKHIIEFEEQLLAVKNELNLSKNAKIKIHKKLYPNVHITINDINTISNREHEQCIISCKDYEIHFN